MPKITTTDQLAIMIARDWLGSDYHQLASHIKTTLDNHLSDLNSPQGNPTETAYKIMLGEKGVHKLIGVSDIYIRKLRFQARRGDFPNEDIMSARLTAAGYQVISEKKWLKK
jgi:hypothetical protein